MLLPVILSGGSGSRLWPLSRELYPKQLLPLVTENTLLQDTVLRLQGLDACGDPLLICNEQHRFLVAEQLRKIGVKASAIVLEPIGRNTAPAVAVAALLGLDEALSTTEDGDSILLVLPADHVINDVQAFLRAVAVGREQAVQGKLVTFGIVPRSAETGYGYIQRGAEHGDAFAVAQFVEKPDLATAEKYLESGEFYWNSGMFMFQASKYLRELQNFNPDILSSCQTAMDRAQTDLDFLRLDTEAFTACPSDSIDYAVMEKTSDAVVVPLDAGWNDVGSWTALQEAVGVDANGNLFKGDVLAEDTQGTYVHADGRLVATLGVKDHVVIETTDAVLVASKDRVQDVKKLVERLRSEGRGEAGLHREVHRPWGSYDSLENGERYQVKRITVKPGGVLSLQMHHHRAEHWIVVKGTAKVTRGDEEFLLAENESTYLPLGTTHRLENPGVFPLDLIEVQTGSYLGEDDIVRFDDQYGREGTNT